MLRDVVRDGKCKVRSQCSFRKGISQEHGWRIHYQGDALGQQYEARQGGPEGDLTDEGYSLSSRRRDNDFSKSRRTYDTDFDAVRGAFQDTGETLRDQQSASGSGGRLNTVGRRQQHDCDNNDIAECVGLLEVLTNKDLGFAASVDELNNMCPVLLNGLQCIDNYTRRCLSLKHREYFNKLYAGTIRVIKDLCNTKGKYQLEYIRHAPCMRQVNPKYNGCSEAYHKKTADLNQINDAVVQLSDEEKNKNVITLCCSFQEYLQCSEQVVFETCGNETALFTKEFLDRMAGPIVQDLCQAFYFSLHSCSQESSTSAQKTVVDSDKEVFHDPSTLSSGSDSVDPHSSVQSMLPHSDSSLVSVSLSPRRETFIETTTNELLTVPSDNASVHGEVDFVREVRPHSHTTPVSVEVEAVSEKTEEATDSMFKCLNYAPGSQDCSAGSASVWPSHMSLTLLVTTLLFFRWFVA
ncbi:uncharacterized protein LOC135218277 isoform X1 [Macrobrachium nipponense]|uniref:uncharacterized protein LOC135218277 isoform X1 n=1 Tax=Macrobrachium nipponense TaxID=159736 RepID=UPI0030C7D69D